MRKCQESSAFATQCADIEKEYDLLTLRDGLSLPIAKTDIDARPYLIEELREAATQLGFRLGVIYHAAPAVYEVFRYRSISLKEGTRAAPTAPVGKAASYEGATPSLCGCWRSLRARCVEMGRVLATVPMTSRKALQGYGASLDDLSSGRLPLTLFSRRLYRNPVFNVYADRAAAIKQAADELCALGVMEPTKATNEDGTPSRRKCFKYSNERLAAMLDNFDAYAVSVWPKRDIDAYTNGEANDLPQAETITEAWQGGDWELPAQDDE